MSNSFESVLDFEILQSDAARQDFLQQGAKPWDVPLVIAQLVKDCFQFFIDTLPFFIGGGDLFIGSLEFLVGCFILFLDGLNEIACFLEFTFHVGNALGHFGMAGFVVLVFADRLRNWRRYGEVS